MPPSPSRRRIDPVGPNPLKRRAWRDGRRGEFWATLFLRCKLYRIVATRYRTPVGEIDIVAERFGVTVFIEVKTRAFSHDEVAAWAAVDIRRIAAAAGQYIARHPHLAARDQRFDVIFLAPFAWPRHVVNAFDMPRSA